MIALYGFGPGASLPDLSPFVMKAMLLLKFAGLDFTVNTDGFSRAPKGKLPYIDDAGTIVADSTFIRFHIEQTRGFDFDAGLSTEQRAQAWAIEKMCEEHLLWIIARIRWLDDANMEGGLARIFEKAPAPARPLVKWILRRKIAKMLWAQGMGRHTAQDIDTLGARNMEALSTLLGDKTFLFGDTPRGADAALFAFIALTLDPYSNSSVRDAALAKPNLVAYRDRIMGAYFPQFAES
jgi:glutathione S-transferase